MEKLERMNALGCDGKNSKVWESFCDLQLGAVSVTEDVSFSSWPIFFRGWQPINNKCSEFI